MALPENLLDFLHVKRIRVATEMSISDKVMKAYVVVIPIKEVKELKYYNNLAETISYEIRLIKHKKIYNADEWGYDWDYVIDDVSTRIKRIFVDRSEDNKKLEKVLVSLNININNFNRIRYYDSPIIDDDIDNIFENKNEHLHLWQKF